MNETKATETTKLDVQPEPRAEKVREPEKPYEFPELIAELQKLYEEGLQSTNLHEGKLLTGKISAIEANVVLLDLGESRTGQAPRNEFKSEPKAGDEVKVIVEQQRESGPWLLSKVKADDLARYEAVMAACERDEPIEGTIVARVKGGLSVDIGLRAFLPGSHVAEQFIEDLNPFVGKRLPFRVIKVDAKRGSIMLSRKAISAQENTEKKKEILATLKEGDVKRGTVKSIMEYGAFVDIGGIDGLLHVSDMSWSRVKHAKDVVKTGDEVNVKVLRFTAETGKISLGMKQLTTDPWSGAAEKFAVNSRITGKVVRLADFGAFVEVAPGVDGLLHVSDLSWDRRDQKGADDIKVGKEIELVVLSVDEASHKLRLGRKQLTANPWVAFLEAHPIGSTVKGTVRGLTDFGAFVQLAENIDGLLHISECSWTVRFRSPGDVLAKGDEIEAVVIKADADQERISLSIKQKYPDPWEKIIQEYPVGRIVPVTVKKALREGLLVEVAPGFEGYISWREVPDVDPKKAEPKEAAPAEAAPTPEAPEQEKVKLQARDEAKAKQYKVGTNLSAQVIHVNPTERKFRLSAKDVTSDEDKQNFVEYIAQNANEQQKATAKLGDLMKDVLEKKPEEPNNPQQ
jgi:small subunit ribosomal protein S1